MFASVQELIQGTRQVIDLNGGVRVKDPDALRGETIDRLVHTAVFGDEVVRDAAKHRIGHSGQSPTVVDISHEGHIENVRSESSERASLPGADDIGARVTSQTGFACPIQQRPHSVIPPRR